jgi:selenide,water dikinase
MVALTSLSHGAGCGCKLPAASLGPLLSGLPRTPNPDVLVGFDTSDDAGVVRVRDDLAIVTTADFFTPIVDDPFSLDELGGEVLVEILRGAAAVADDAGIPIVGGHSIDDAEPKFGWAVTGVVAPDAVVTNAGGRVGDAVVLTKPLGAGAVSTALKRGLGDAPLADAVGVMTTLNRDGSAAALAAGVHGMTDVTGFGLLGHLHELALASGVAAEVDAAAVPAIQGVVELLSDPEERAVAGGTRRNRAHAEEFASFADDVPDALRWLVCDAMTSGGLLAAVEPGRACDLPGAVVARLVDGPAGTITVR